MSLLIRNFASIEHIRRLKGDLRCRAVDGAEICLGTAFTGSSAGAYFVVCWCAAGGIAHWAMSAYDGRIHTLGIVCQLFRSEAWVDVLEGENWYSTFAVRDSCMGSIWWTIVSIKHKWAKEVGNYDKCCMWNSQRGTSVTSVLDNLTYQGSAIGMGEIDESGFDLHSLRVWPFMRWAISEQNNERVVRKVICVISWRLFECHLMP